MLLNFYRGHFISDSDFVIFILSKFGPLVTFFLIHLKKKINLLNHIECRTNLVTKENSLQYHKRRSFSNKLIDAKIIALFGIICCCETKCYTFCNDKNKNKFIKIMIIKIKLLVCHRYFCICYFKYAIPKVWGCFRKGDNQLQ